MYEQNMSTLEFLNVTFVLMRKKVQKLKEINSKAKRGKLPLPLIKQKFEMTSDILKALRMMIGSIDYEKPEAEDLVEIYNTIGHRLSLANIDMDDKMYQNVIDIIEGFLDI